MSACRNRSVRSESGSFFYFFSRKNCFPEVADTTTDMVLPLVTGVWVTLDHVRDEEMLGFDCSVNPLALVGQESVAFVSFFTIDSTGRGAEVINSVICVE